MEDQLSVKHKIILIILLEQPKYRLKNKYNHHLICQSLGIQMDMLFLKVEHS